jgi:hypothetical protein
MFGFALSALVVSGLFVIYRLILVVVRVMLLNDGSRTFWNFVALSKNNSNSNKSSSDWSFLYIWISLSGLRTVDKDLFVVVLNCRFWYLGLSEIVNFFLRSGLFCLVIQEVSFCRLKKVVGLVIFVVSEFVKFWSVTCYIVFYFFHVVGVVLGMEILFVWLRQLNFYSIFVIILKGDFLVVFYVCCVMLIFGLDGWA